MPAFGLGTYQVSAWKWVFLWIKTIFFQSLGNEGGEATKHAIDIGYRHFDTARLYENEQEIGQAIQEKINEGVVKREDIFVVTKLWNTDHKPEDVEKACRTSCDKLSLGYIDLYLMHYPTAFKRRTPLELWPKKGDGQPDEA